VPSDFPTWQTVYAYFAKWNEPGQDGKSVLERALKKSGWRGPASHWTKRTGDAADCGRAERQEHGHGEEQRL